MSCESGHGRIQRLQKGTIGIQEEVDFAEINRAAAFAIHEIIENIVQKGCSEALEWISVAEVFSRERLDNEFCVAADGILTKPMECLFVVVKVFADFHESGGWVFVGMVEGWLFQARVNQNTEFGTGQLSEKRRILLLG